LDPHRTQESVGDGAPRSIIPISDSGIPISGITYTLPKNIDVKMNDGSIVTMDLEEYLKGVLPKEIGASFPMEAMKAQAVAARTYTVDYTGGGKKAICITTQCQVWSSTRYAATDQAVDATKGQVAVYVGSEASYKGKLAGGYYAASCGGSTINSENKWSYRPFLRAKTCIENKTGACSAVCKTTDASSNTCWGIYGHRIGLCQRGAQSMGKCNKTHIEIVKHYYTDVDIANLAITPPPVNDAALINEDIPASTVMQPEQKFRKRWQLENRGNTTWSAAEGYSLVRLSGEVFGGAAKIDLAANEKITNKQQKDFAIDLVAPKAAGKYSSTWQMDHKGTKFGQIVKIEITVKAPEPEIVDDAVLVDEDIPAGTVMQPEQKFRKRWRLENRGNTTWSAADGYALVRISGEDFAANSKIDLSQDEKIAPQQHKDFSMDFIAPQKPGIYESQWQMETKGKKFGEIAKIAIVVKSEAKNCVDNDGDGYFAPQEGCPEPFDCDDNNKNIYPGAPEICGNSIDEDCSGSDAKCPLQCVDNDGDGYFAPQAGCSEPFDCDDNNSNIYPGAPEICGNGIDENCSGTDLPCKTAQKQIGDSGCEQGSDCITGVCVVYRDQSICSQRCSTDKDCPDNYFCFQNAACWPMSSQNNPDGKCQTDADCNGGICLNGTCNSLIYARGCGVGCSQLTSEQTFLGWQQMLAILTLLLLSCFVGFTRRT
jgi:hypothetical protein